MTVKNYRPVYWGHGEFLVPQHLQQQDLHWATIAAAHLRGVRDKHAWGFIELNIDEESLTVGQFVVTSCMLITQHGSVWRFAQGRDESDGNSFRANSTNGNLKPVKVPSSFIAGNPALPVWLAVPQFDSQNQNWTTSDDTPSVRFKRLDEPTSDILNPKHEVGRNAKIKFLDLQPQIMFGEAGGPSRAGWEAIQIANLRYEPQKEVLQLDPEFSPPSLSVGCSSVLLLALDQLRNHLSHNLELLWTGLDWSGSTSSSVQRLARAQTIARAHAYVSHVCADKSAHPETVYAMLRQFVAEFGVLYQTPDGMADLVFDPYKEENRAIAPYKHENPAIGFQKSLHRIRDLTKTPEDVDREVFLQWNPGEARFEALNISPRFFAAADVTVSYYLMFESRSLDQWQILLNGAVLSEIQQLGDKLKYGDSGILIKPSTNMDVRAQANLIYYQLTTKGIGPGGVEYMSQQQWDHVVKRKNIALATKNKGLWANIDGRKDRVRLIRRDSDGQS